MTPPGVVGPLRLRLSDELYSLIRHLHPELKRKVRAGLEEILRDPTVGKVLREELNGLRSFRVGRLRIIYRLAAQSVEVVAVGPRRRIYADTWRLVKREDR